VLLCFISDTPNKARSTYNNIFVVINSVFVVPTATACVLRYLFTNRVWTVSYSEYTTKCEEILFVGGFRLCSHESVKFYSRTCKFVPVLTMKAFR